jgi:hypothetical protein
MHSSTTDTQIPDDSPHTSESESCQGLFEGPRQSVAGPETI